MADKKISPREAALAILNRAAELYKSSPLAKSEDLKKGDWKKIHDKLEREGYSKESADKIDGSIKAKMNKSDEMGANPDAQADAQLGEKVEQDVQSHEAQNEDPAHHEKGSYKLAKFMGRRELKRGQKEVDKSVSTGSGMPSAETGHEKGINTRVDPRNPISISDAGREARSAGKWAADKKAGIGSTKVTGALAREHKGAAKEAHKQVLGQMQSMPKPKLPG